MAGYKNQIKNENAISFFGARKEAKRIIIEATDEKIKQDWEGRGWVVTDCCNEVVDKKVF